MESQYLLSICIPTYNRAPYLKQCLDSLVCQPEFLKGDVEIVISDNASTDGTMILIKNYQKKYKNITYHRNTKNIGIRNIGLVATMAHGMFCKLGNDNLIYQNDSLNYFCKIINKYQETKPLLWFSNGNYRMNAKEEEVIYSPEQFLCTATFYITWIGAIGIWKEEVKAYDQCFDKVKNELGQTENLINLLQQHRPVVFFIKIFATGPAVKKKDISYGVFRVFYTDYLNLLRPLIAKKVISDACFNRLEKDLFFGFFINSILEWELNRDNYIFSEKENLKKAVFNQYRGKPYFKKACWAYTKAKIKRKLKRIPGLGMLLIKLKQMI